jgi:hypothetical protein
LPKRKIKMKEYKNPKKISNNAKGSLEENEAIEKSQFLSNNIDGQVAWARPISRENCSMTGDKWSWHNCLYAVDRATAKKGAGPGQ